jgi:hypothetical protein
MNELHIRIITLICCNLVMISKRVVKHVEGCRLIYRVITNGVSDYLNLLVRN